MKGPAKILWYDSLDSTQDAVKREIDSLPNLAVVASGYQSAGRGQRGNSWLAQPWENLTFSIYLRLDGATLCPFHARDQFVISILTTLAVHDYLSSRGIDSNIKWPNDIYCGNRKICGILIENRLGAEGVRDSVIGIGLNVNQSEFPPNLPNPTSMMLLTGRVYDVKQELELFMEVFTGLLSALEEPDGPARLRDRYLHLMYRKDRCHVYVDCIGGGETFEGTIRGIDGDYKLLVETSTGEIRSFAFKEINYVI